MAGGGLDILVLNSGTPHLSLVLFRTEVELCFYFYLFALKVSSAFAGLAASRSDLGWNSATVTSDCPTVRQFVKLLKYQIVRMSAHQNVRFFYCHPVKLANCHTVRL